MTQIEYFDARAMSDGRVVLTLREGADETKLTFGDPDDALMFVQVVQHACRQVKEQRGTRLEDA